MSVDTALGLVYLPHGSPTLRLLRRRSARREPLRRSIVALDAATGKVKWYFQAVHHDTWDYDFNPRPSSSNRRGTAPEIPALADGVEDKALSTFSTGATASRSSAWKRDPCPKATSRASTTGRPNRVPIKPAPVARQSFTAADIAKVTPEQEKFCTDMLATEGGMHNDGPFTRYNTTLSIVFPGHARRQQLAWRVGRSHAQLSFHERDSPRPTSARW